MIESRLCFDSLYPSQPLPSISSLKIVSDKPNSSKTLKMQEISTPKIENEQRIFESEAKTGIQRALEGKNNYEEADWAENNDHPRRREDGLQSMATRANAVSNLPVVHEEEGAGNSMKSLELFHDSSMSMTSSAHRLKDIARRIQMVQRAYSRRRRLSSNPLHDTSVEAGSQDFFREGGSPERINSQLTDRGMHRKSTLIGSLFNGNNTIPTTISDRRNDTEYELDMIEDGIVTETVHNRHLHYYHKFIYFLKTKKHAMRYFFRVIFYGILPLVGASAGLFYFAGNPIGPLDASYSWWLLFLARLGATFLCAQLGQYIFIDFIALETQFTVMIFGRVFILVAMQARGWPVLLMFWSILNYGLLYGGETYVKHWLYWQNGIALFNESNPSGSVTTYAGYLPCLIIFVLCSSLTMLKRVLVAMLLGKKKYGTYGKKMTQIMSKVLLISEIGLLAEEIEDGAHNSTPNIHHIGRSPPSGWIFSQMKSQLDLGGVRDDRQEDEEIIEDTPRVSIRDDVVQQQEKEKNNSRRKMWSKKHKKSSKKRNGVSIDESTKAEIEKLLDEWEEPEISKQKLMWNDSSIRMILQFKETLNYMDSAHPLSIPFGLADTQKHCLESSRKVYDRLLAKSSGTRVLKFETILAIAIKEDGRYDREKVKALKRLFHPRRNGDITLLDFMKACNDVYKRIKMFRAKTLNSAQLDDAFEQLINILFYFVLGLIALGILGVDPFDVFISMTGILVPLAFLFNDAGSKYFQGLLLILVRQPFDIGDCIAISSPTVDTDINGSVTWFVENITLFTTTIRSVPSNEVATISNGALASTRIINAARSHRAQVFVFLKFSVDIPYEKVKIFRSVVEEFITDRSREWVQLCTFRSIKVEADQGYIEYEILAQHVESWQMIGRVLKSKADLSSFCLEVMKQMDMRYISPSMPVNISLDGKDEQEGTTADDDVPQKDELDPAYRDREEISRLLGISNLFPMPPPPNLQNADSSRSLMDSTRSLM